MDEEEFRKEVLMRWSQADLVFLGMKYQKLSGKLEKELWAKDAEITKLKAEVEVWKEKSAEDHQAKWDMIKIADDLKADLERLSIKYKEECDIRARREKELKAEIERLKEQLEERR